MRKLFAIFCIIAIAIFSGYLVSQQKTALVILTWDAPTTRIDGTLLPASEILEYEITCTDREAVVDGSLTTHQFIYNRQTEAGTKVCTIKTRATGDTPEEVLVSAPSAPAVEVIIPRVVVIPKPPEVQATVRVI